MGCAGAASQPAESAAEGDGFDRGQSCLDDARAKRDKLPHEPEVIGVSHILVRHAGSQGTGASATRTDKEACLRVLEALDMLKKGATFEEAVEKFSDAKGATKGSLGKVRREDLDSRFADTAFALDIDELSYVVETDAGYHVILRTE
jgi:parvulin-like peptidyl-prolyl isomerase